MNTYETTKEMNRAHERWFDALPHDQPVPLMESLERLREIRQNYSDRTQEIRFWENLDFIKEELNEMAKSIAFYERFVPRLHQEIYRVLHCIELICGEPKRTYLVDIDFDTFWQDRVDYILRGVMETPIQFVTKSKFSRYRSGFPATWLAMNIEQIKREMR